MATLHKSILSLGITAPSLTTTSLTLNEDFDWNNGMQISKGFKAQQSLQVKVYPLDLLPALLDLTVPSPAQYPPNPDNNTVKVSLNGLRFDVEDRNPLEAACLSKAVTAARAKLESAAAAAGVSLGRVLSIVDSQSTLSPSPLGGGGCGNGGLCYAAMKYGGDAQGGGSAPAFDLMAGRSSEMSFDARTPIDGGVSGTFYTPRPIRFTRRKLTRNTTPRNPQIVEVMMGVTMTVEIKGGLNKEEGVVAKEKEGGLRG